MSKYQCEVCGANSDKPRCWRHSDKKPLKPSPLRGTTKLKVKKKSPEEIRANNLEIVKQWNFFLEIWRERPHYSEVSGTYLGETPYSYHFEHLLEKSKYEHLKYERDNIILCTMEEHELKTNGHPLPRHQEFIDKAKKRFGIE